MSELERLTSWYLWLLTRCPELCDQLKKNYPIVHIRWYIQGLYFTYKNVMVDSVEGLAKVNHEASNITIIFEHVVCTTSWIRLTKAHQAVLPVSSNAYWSAVLSTGVQGRSQCFTISFSAILKRIAVTDMGWKSDNEVVCETLVTGVTITVSQDTGTKPVWKEQLKIFTTTSVSSNEQLR